MIMNMKPNPPPKSPNLLGRSLSVPHPPRPIEKNPDGSSSSTPKVNNSSQRLSLNSTSSPETDLAPDSLPKQRRRSRVSFSNNITIISSDDEREDQIEVKKNNENLTTASDDSGETSANLLLQDEALFGESTPSTHHPLVPPPFPRPVKELNCENRLHNQKHLVSPSFPRRLRELNLETEASVFPNPEKRSNQTNFALPPFPKPTKRINIATNTNSEDTITSVQNQKHLAPPPFPRLVNMENKDFSGEFKDLDLSDEAKNVDSTNYLVNQTSKKVDGNKTCEIKPRKVLRPLVLPPEPPARAANVRKSLEGNLLETTYTESSDTDLKTKPLSPGLQPRNPLMPLLLPPKFPNSKFPANEASPTLNEIQNNLIRVTEKKPNKLPTAVRPSQPPPLPPKGIKKMKLPVNMHYPREEEQVEVYTPNPLDIIQETPSSVQRSIAEVLKSEKEHSMPNQLHQAPPDLINDNALFRTRNLSTQLVFIIRDLQDSERNYINQLQKCIQIAQEFQVEGIAAATLNKFFGLFQDVHLFHKKVLEDLDRHNGTAKYIPLCFIKHFTSVDIYTKRQWLVPSVSDLDEFESFLLHSRNLKPYITITKDRVNEYIKKLQFFKSNCDEDDTECHKITDKAIKVVENLHYQLEMVEQFKKVDGVHNKLELCGKVYLNSIFSISLNGNKKRNYLVYLCENLIIFTSQQKNGIYQVIDDLPTSEIYCTTTKHKSSVFEVGLPGKRFTLKADSDALKDQWCEQLRRVLRLDQFQDE